MSNERDFDDLLRVEARLRAGLDTGDEAMAVDRVFTRVRAHAASNPNAATGWRWRGGWLTGLAAVGVPLAAAAALLAAVTLGGGRQARVVSPAGSPLPILAPSPSPTLIVGGPSVQLTNLSQLQMTDAQHGWAMIDKPEPPGTAESAEVVTTSDGGRHWTASRLGLNPGPGIGAFVDTRNAWVAFPEAGRVPVNRIRVFRTRDGGATWTESGPITPPNATSLSFQSLQFPDSVHGWLQAQEETPPPAAIHVWRTVDGGATWRQMPDGTGQYTFKDANLGFTGIVVGHSPRLHVTHDGGLTYRTQALPPAPGHVAPPANALPEEWFLGDPAFVNDRDGSALLTAGWGTGATSAQYAALYVTHDGGATWSARKLPATPQVWDYHLAPYLYMIGYVNGDNNTPIRWTSEDWGATWHRQGDTLAVHPREMNLMDRADGLIIGTTGAGDDSLWSTADGGLSWTDLRPDIPQL